MPKQTPIDISLDRLADRLPELINDDLPDILGQAAVDAFKQNFQDEGFFGSGWQEVKRVGPRLIVVEPDEPRISGF